MGFLITYSLSIILTYKIIYVHYYTRTISSILPHPASLSFPALGQQVAAGEDVLGVDALLDGPDHLHTPGRYRLLHPLLADLAD